MNRHAVKRKRGPRGMGGGNRERDDVFSRAVRAMDAILHLRKSENRTWKYLPLTLVLALAVRSAVALSGDYVTHPDEMQYHESAHRMVFGYGVVYWEYFYGARALIVPGVIAGVLILFEYLDLAQPFWYIGAVKLTFCTVSLGIPVGMYFFARRHFDEISARVALLAGAFWYELVGFAHKPMTEFVATAILLALLAMCARPTADRTWAVWLTAFLAVLAAAVRMQYAPIALLLFAVYFIRTEKKTLLVLASVLFVAAVGVFDALSWNGELFHSYLVLLRAYLATPTDEIPGQKPFYQFLWWLLIAGSGLSAFCLTMALRKLRRYGFLLALIALVLLAHSVLSHKEYRFVFLVVPLWLMIGADLAVRLATHRRKQILAILTTMFAAVSLAGIMNALPYQNRLYLAFTDHSNTVRFVRSQEPIFKAYRYLSQAIGVQGVWQHDTRYYGLPGYYFLHRKIPFYDMDTGRMINWDPAAIQATVSHIVTRDVNLAVPGYQVDKTFGDVRILRRDDRQSPVIQWESYSPTIIYETKRRLMERISAEAPPPPVNSGIRLVE